MLSKVQLRAIELLTETAVDGQVLIGWCEKDGAIGTFSPFLPEDSYEESIFLCERMLEHLREWQDHGEKFGYKTRPLRKSNG